MEVIIIGNVLPIVENLMVEKGMKIVSHCVKKTQKIQSVNLEFPFFQEIPSLGSASVQLWKKLLKKPPKLAIAFFAQLVI